MHNIETIQGKEEQNLYTILYNVNPEDIHESQTSPDISVVRFNIPIIIHTTVLPPQQSADYLETGIPKNAKIYANFLNANASEFLRGRFVTDCLFEGLDRNFVSVGSIDDNVHRRISEHRNTLNFTHYKLVNFLTAVFGLIGLIVYIRIIISAFRQPVQFGHHHKHDRYSQIGSRDQDYDEVMQPSITGKEKTE